MRAGRPFQPSRSRAMPKRTILRSSTVRWGSASTTLPQNIAPRPPSCRAYFLVLGWSSAGRRFWDVRRQNTTSNERSRSRTSTHYSFHILDPEMGSSHHQSQRASSLPGPGDLETATSTSPAKARKAGPLPSPRREIVLLISPTPQAWRKIADTLSEQRAIGRLSQVCERWIYTTCLCFALDFEEQRPQRVSLSVFKLSDRVTAETWSLRWAGTWNKCFRR